MEPEGRDEAAADASMISNNSPYQPTTEPVPNRTTICAGLIMDTEYVKSIQGLLKLVEFLFCIVALICLGQATCGSSCSGISFLHVVSATSLVVTLLLFVVFALTLNTKIPFVHWPLTDLLNAGISCIFYIIASSVLASQSGGTSPGGTAAVVFGFFNAILFGISTWMAYRTFVVERHKRRSHVPGVADNA